MQTPLFTSDQAPKFSSKLSLAVLNALGWKLRYNGLPANHGVLIFYPHTSNWDFIYGMLVKLAIRFPLKFLVKEKLFKGVTGFFIGGFVRYCGGEPIERGVSSGAIPKLAERMQRADWYWIGITPEGTRKFTPHWRSGFYHIALTAKVPLACAYIDYPKKEIGIYQSLELTGDEAIDLANIRKIYEHAQGKYPDQHGTISFKN
jgi:1-acyl-sn-glycerol-3-phosphate acyltransferase